MESRTYHRFNFTELSILLRLLFLILIISADVSYSTIRYVSKTGSSEAPYLTWETASDSIQKCINICNNGDTVVVANGVYKEYLIIDSVLTLLGSSMDSTVIDGTGLNKRAIKGNNDFAIYNFTIIGKETSGDTYVISNIFYNTSVINCRIRNANIGLSIGESSGTIDGVIIENVRRAGIYSYCGSDTCKPVIQNSIIHIPYDQSAADLDGIYYNFGGIFKIYNNIIIAEDGSWGIGTLSYVTSVDIRNNLISGFNINIKANSVRDTIFIINNVLSEQKSLFSDDANIRYPVNGVVRNNIIMNSETGINYGNYPANEEYNLFWNNSRNIDAGNVLSETDIIADPMFVKDTIARSMAFDYHLQAFSPAIDAGDPTILDTDGSRSDIGMFGGPLGESYTYQNLAPKPPKNIKTAIKGDTLNILWDKASERDHSHFNIYSSISSDLTADSSNFIQKADTNSVKLLLPKNKEKVYYLITSVDSAGNESLAGEKVSVIITDAGKAETEIIKEYKLYPNYPNPFNPSTTIPFRLKAAGYVKIIIYDIKGELIRTVLNEEKEEGYHEVRFNAEGLPSGLYLYKIEIIGAGRIPVYSEMRKMLLLK